MKFTPSLFIAFALALLTGGWLLSGQFSESPQNYSKSNFLGKKQLQESRAKVQIRKSKALKYIANIRVTGETQSSREVTIRTQLAGKISKTVSSNGQTIKSGEIIVELEPENWPERSKEAEARVKQRELEFSAAQKLSKKGFKSETLYAAAFADLEQSKAVAKKMQQNLLNTIIRSPFGGILSSRYVEIGDVLRKGDPVAHLIDLQPALITAFISERYHLDVRPGRKALARLPNGTEISGVIRYVSPIAQKTTRTFKVELEIANPENELVAGTTAELIIPLPPVSAHQLSAALFSLNSKGELGIKTVDERSSVKFYPIEIVGGTDTEVFVTGLPEECKIIVVGQGFVNSGEEVRAFIDGDEQGQNS